MGLFKQSHFLCFNEDGEPLRVVNLSNFYPLPNDLYGFDIKVSYTSNKLPYTSLLFVYIIIISYLCERIHKTQ